MCRRHSTSGASFVCRNRLLKYPFASIFFWQAGALGLEQLLPYGPAIFLEVNWLSVAHKSEPSNTVRLKSIFSCSGQLLPLTCLAFFMYRMNGNFTQTKTLVIHHCVLYPPLPLKPKREKPSPHSRRRAPPVPTSPVLCTLVCRTSPCQCRSPIYDARR